MGACFTVLFLVLYFCTFYFLVHSALHFRRGHGLLIYLDQELISYRSHLVVAALVGATCAKKPKAASFQIGLG